MDVDKGLFESAENVQLISGKVSDGSSSPVREQAKNITIFKKSPRHLHKTEADFRMSDLTLCPRTVAIPAYQSARLASTQIRS